MRKALAAAALVAGPLYLRRRRLAQRERVRIHFDDGSSVALEAGRPDVDRLLALARHAL